MCLVRKANTWSVERSEGQDRTEIINLVFKSHKNLEGRMGRAKTTERKADGETERVFKKYEDPV